MQSPHSQQYEFQPNRGTRISAIWNFWLGLLASLVLAMATDPASAQLKGDFVARGAG
jgi:hypothetical protein